MGVDETPANIVPKSEFARPRTIKERGGRGGMKVCLI